MPTQPRILVSPLNWGLGHASRCVPVIRELLQQGAEVIIGAEEGPSALLKTEFPQLDFLEFPGYDITYPSGGNMAVHMLKIMPKILAGIKKENALLAQKVKELDLTGVISDNRFGLHTELVPTVFMTHQIMIKAPYGESFIRKLNGRFMNKFSQVWIPDFADEPNLSGDLAHLHEAPENSIFIGPLSRFSQPRKNEADTFTYDALAIISGPEPQRTLFQHIVQTEFELSGLKTAMVLGKAEMAFTPEVDGIRIFNHLPAKELEKLITESRIVVSRSGYSTLMDLAQTGKNAILIPTPGQTEQEYLADLHMNAKHYFSVEQDRFDLDEALQHVANYSGLKLQPDPSLLERAVTRFLEAC
jgi:UDP-N-acetylglucosamine transferase subunit ALG13